MTFVHPWVAWLACAVPIAVALLVAYDRARRAQLTRRLGELPVIGRVMATVSPRRRAIKAAIASLGFALVVFALARPQAMTKRVVELRGLDVVVALDASKSMLVTDVGATAEMALEGNPTTRLARARALAAALFEAIPNDRIAPVVFAGAVAHFPLTADRKVASDFLDGLGPADLPPGSNLAEVVRVGRCLLRPDLYDSLGCRNLGRNGHGGDPLPGDPDDPRDSLPKADVLEGRADTGRAIVLLSDGGDADPGTLREVAAARELGIAVVVVGFGSTAGGVVHEIDENGRATAAVKHARDGQTVISKRDDAGMRAIATAGGDERRYLVEPGKGEVDPAPIVNALKTIDVERAKSTTSVRRDVFEPFLFAGFMLLVIEAAIGTRRRRSRYPEAG